MISSILLLLLGLLQFVRADWQDAGLGCCNDVLVIEQPAWIICSNASVLSTMTKYRGPACVLNKTHTIQDSH
jgi:hypothetical protein